MHLVLLLPSIIQGVQLFVAPECLFINVFKSKITPRLLLLLCHQSPLGINKPGFGKPLPKPGPWFAVLPAPLEGVEALGGLGLGSGLGLGLGLGFGFGFRVSVWLWL